MYNMEEGYWWYVAMRRITDSIVADDVRGRALTVLDAGCGTGYNIHHYAKAGHKVFAFDIAEPAIAFVRKRGFQRVARASAVEIPYRSETFDFAYCLDVLDELPVEKAEEAIREIRRVLKPGGGFLIRLPAFNWMRSSHDEELHTLHRYSRSELQAMMSRAGFEPRFTSYANTVLFPVVLLHRAMKKVGVDRGTDTKPLPRFLKWLDPIFRNALGAEALALGARRGLPFGLSLIGYARKR
jgi:SAM-dependent methyltransferase